MDPTDSRRAPDVGFAWRISVAVGLAVLAVLAGLWFLDPLGWRSSLPANPGAAGSASSSPPANAPSDAEAAASVLTTLADDPVAGAAAGTRSAVDPDAALPPGTKLAPDQQTWAPDGIGGGTMEVVLSTPGRSDERFIAVMVKEDGQWKVLGTLNQEETVDAP